MFLHPWQVIMNPVKNAAVIFTFCKGGKLDGCWERSGKLLLHLLTHPPNQYCVFHFTKSTWLKWWSSLTFFLSFWYDFAASLCHFTANLVNSAFNSLLLIYSYLKVLWLKPLIITITSNRHNKRLKKSQLPLWQRREEKGCCQNRPPLFLCTFSFHLCAAAQASETCWGWAASPAGWRSTAFTVLKL